LDAVGATSAPANEKECVMNLPSKIFAVCLLGATPIGLADAAGAAPLGGSLALHEAASSAVQNVQWRGRWGGWGGPGWGFAAGALAGGALAAATSPWYGYDYDYDYAPAYTGYYTGYGPDYYGYDPGYTTYSYRYSPGYSTYGYSAGGRDAAYCMQRFRSYNPASGTYLGYDGIRHPCP
jgi:BA14K-like protein